MNRRLIWSALLLLSVTVFWTGCGGEPSMSKTYPIKGKVTSVDLSSVRIDHEAIPGYMAAMEMQFAVAGAEVVEGIKVGDQVHGELTVESGKPVISQLKKQ